MINDSDKITQQFYYQYYCLNAHHICVSVEFSLTATTPMSNNAIIAGLLTDIQDYFIYPLIKYPHMVLSF